MNNVEEAIKACQKRYVMMHADVASYLEQHNPGMHQYLQDSQDNMDAWEHPETFFAVFYDWVIWHKETL